MNQQHRIWNYFCAYHNVYKAKVPLFATIGLKVQTKVIGRGKLKTILCRNPQMEALIRVECSKLIKDWKEKTYNFDGLIYLMLLENEGNLIPLYIGKTDTMGKGDGNLSANIKNIETNTRNFARWGDSYDYHIGDLSAVAVPGHGSKKVKLKYKDWAGCLFKKYPAANPKLKRQVYFWAKAWGPKETGPWVDYGPTSLNFLEYLLIGLASSAYGDKLLNRKGRNQA